MEQTKVVSSATEPTSASLEQDTSPPPKSSTRQSHGHKHKRTPSTFVWSKVKLLLRLTIYITLGVLLANVLELSKAVKYLAFLAWPLIHFGRLGKSTGSAFLMAFQSGAIANSILVANRDSGKIDERQLYTSVLIVSCLSLFAHLPTYVLPVGSVLGAQATAALFGARFVSIVLEIIFILMVGSFAYKRLAVLVATSDAVADADGNGCLDRNDKPKRHRHGETDSTDAKTQSFALRVWRRSRVTLRRLLIYIVPTFLVMGILEYLGLFSTLGNAAPKMFTLNFLPPQSAIIVPAQALSLYNGALAAAGFVSQGDIDVKQAVTIILVGSVITAPIRTLKHAMPTYIAILGAKMGTVMSITSQILRSIFLIITTIGLWLLW